MLEKLYSDARRWRNFTPWEAPISGWVKINVNGAVTRLGGRAGCGGVLRDHDGKWIAGLTQYLGICGVFEAEQWAVVKGLNLAWELGLRQIIVESDAKDLIDLLMDGSNNKHEILLFGRIREFLSRKGSVQVRFIQREKNRLADILAKKGISSSSFLDSCPEYALSMLSQKDGVLLTPILQRHETEENGEKK